MNSRAGSGLARLHRSSFEATLMLRTSSPSTLIADRIHDLQRHLPGVYDGVEIAVHDARVAVRRACAVFSLVADQYDDDAIADIQKRLSKAARALGRVRDADSSQRLAQDVEQRFPYAAATLSLLRVRLADSQYASRRKAIKKLEALELESLPGQLARAQRSAIRRWPFHTRSWKLAIPRAVGLRAEQLRRSIAHATGVYFPNRAHAARIAIKQLRYSLELAAALGALRGRRGLRVLRKAQNVLGAAHDREVLLEHVDALRRSEADRINLTEADALARFLRAEALALHRRYLEWRGDLIAICETYTPSRRRLTVARRAAVIAGIGVPTLLLWQGTTSST
jgi:CHAD domain-containing protein